MPVKVFPSEVPDMEGFQSSGFRKMQLVHNMPSPVEIQQIFSTLKNFPAYVLRIDS